MFTDLRPCIHDTSRMKLKLPRIRSESKRDHQRDNQLSISLNRKININRLFTPPIITDYSNLLLKIDNYVMIRNAYRYHSLTSKSYMNFSYFVEQNCHCNCLELKKYSNIYHRGFKIVHSIHMRHVHWPLLIYHLLNKFSRAGVAYCFFFIKISNDCTTLTG
jgi:hypothetical protein